MLSRMPMVMTKLLVAIACFWLSSIVAATAAAVNKSPASTVALSTQLRHGRQAAFTMSRRRSRRLPDDNKEKDKASDGPGDDEDDDDDDDKRNDDEEMPAPPETSPPSMATTTTTLEPTARPLTYSPSMSNSIVKPAPTSLSTQSPSQMPSAMKAIVATDDDEPTTTTVSNLTLVAFRVTVWPSDIDITPTLLASTIRKTLEDYLYTEFAMVYDTIIALDLVVVESKSSVFVFNVKGKVSFDDAAGPPVADLQALQTKMLQGQDHLETLNMALVTASQNVGNSETDEAPAIIQSITVGASTAAAAPTMPPASVPTRQTNTSAAAAVGGVVAAAAVLVLVTAAIMLRKSLRVRRKTLHVSLSEDNDDDYDDASTDSSPRSTEMPCYDLEIQARGTQFRITSTASMDQQDYDDDFDATKEHRMTYAANSHQGRSKLAAPSRDEEDESYADDEYSLASCKESTEVAADVDSCGELDRSPMSTTIVPVSSSCSSPLGPLRRYASKPPVYEDGDDGDIYSSDNESLFTRTPETPQRKPVVQQQRAPASLRLPEQSLRTLTSGSTASKTVRRSNTRRANRGLYDVSTDDDDDDDDSDEDLDELMGPMPQLNILQLQRQQQAQQERGMPLTETFVGSRSKSNKKDSHHENSSQPSDEAMDERDRDLTGFALELEAARSGNSQQLSFVKSFSRA